MICIHYSINDIFYLWNNKRAHHLPRPDRCHAPYLRHRNTKQKTKTLSPANRAKGTFSSHNNQGSCPDNAYEGSQTAAPPARFPCPAAASHRHGFPPGRASAAPSCRPSPPAAAAPLPCSSQRSGSSKASPGPHSGMAWTYRLLHQNRQSGRLRHSPPPRRCGIPA